MRKRGGEEFKWMNWMDRKEIRKAREKNGLIQRQKNSEAMNS